MGDGQPDKALALCDELLKNPTPEAIQFVTNLLASQGQADRAAKILDGLERINLKPGERELIRAEYAAKFGDPKLALGYYKMAVTNAPTQPFVWRSYITFSIISSGMDDALKVIDEAHAVVKVAGLKDDKAIKDAAAIGAIWEARKDLQALGQIASFTSVVMAFVNQPTQALPLSSF